MQLLHNPADIYEAVKLRSLPLIKHYHDDLIKHDRSIIADLTPFLHWTRESGTHIAVLLEAHQYPTKGQRTPHLFGMADREELLSIPLTLARHCDVPGNGRSLLCLHFDGKFLHEIQTKRAIVVAEEHRASTRYQWDRANYRSTYPIDLAEEIAA